MGSTEDNQQPPFQTVQAGLASGQDLSIVQALPHEEPGMVPAATVFLSSHIAIRIPVSKWDLFVRLCTRIAPGGYLYHPDDCVRYAIEHCVREITDTFCRQYDDTANSYKWQLMLELFFPGKSQGGNARVQASSDAEQ